MNSVLLTGLLQRLLIALVALVALWAVYFLGGIAMSIVVENLTVSYQRRPVVHHVDMVFEDGKMWTIFGPNGAGKSTLLKAIMGLQKTDTGSVRYENMARKDIAYLPQQSDIDRSQPMTVFELAAMGLWV